MKAFFVLTLTTLATLSTGSAHAAADFCAPQVASAAQALASANGTISEMALAPTSSDGRKYLVTLTEGGVQDYYSVITTGGHECLVKSVEVLGQPTPRY